MPKFLSCLPSRQSAAAQYDPLLPASTHLTNDADNQKTIASCIFCDVSRDKGFNIVYEDQELIAFHDRTPRAATHLLIIPRSHVASSVRQLTHEHLLLLDSMTALARTLVPSKPAPKLGFHIPPFSSVPHIHLHVFSGPHTFIGKFKYPVTTYAAGKGLGWFVTVEQARNTLERGETIGLGRC
ncbi:hypothetical protein C343_01567 [Cryptococcus neoformans C23]|uniref:HIT domain-containing protein n=2 Tax=Cryptococcus neoformans TaxID=5207 RepID=A0A854QGJ4_CRYNE|nr:hypothetical protein CNAG_07968 [Cryptococcus neoformans var. grubii H99]AUB23244.1 hypothetical protein CKF44_07968 [Cryptococcus neoformans var. grubii]OWZ34253.1 hypothetical protein C347_01636 [Cryptococcus neoformans var. grubii AD2-60a]OWZ46337.1 hypothetical protein C343_01567 [Cryptococcus neoformans var. grubii C23]OWZ49862.1 hypothetical protein C353_01582 [Cryptococcus neoformans var. grubii AD1-83a]OWZ55457.1 hypothetical protein C368_02396 [Cryptococcus neoformans var. grubii 1|eukprot:XP_012048425.1 hypothetical protein CNAG_07968 [Cryptococcus neoformans var. grubii H99]